MTITKTADNAKVNAGEDIGFTVQSVTNGGTGLAKGVEIDDPLPARAPGWTGCCDGGGQRTRHARSYRHASDRDPELWSGRPGHR